MGAVREIHLLCMRTTIDDARSKRYSPTLTASGNPWCQPFEVDHSLQNLLSIYLPDEVRQHMHTHFTRLGSLVGNTLDDLAATADRNPPILHVRDRQGRDMGHVEKHPTYQQLERIAFSQFEMGAMSHRPVLGWPLSVHHVSKYTFQYLFSQSEFGLMCPLSMTDALTPTLRRFASAIEWRRRRRCFCAGRDVYDRAGRQVRCRRNSDDCPSRWQWQRWRMVTSGFVPT
jgi:hypothetical protein